MPSRSEISGGLGHLENDFNQAWLPFWVERLSDLSSVALN